MKEKKEVEQKLYKSSIVAQQLGISQMTLKRHVKLGLIECITINTHRYFTQEQIDAYLEKGRNKNNG